VRSGDFSSVGNTSPPVVITYRAVLTIPLSFHRFFSTVHGDSQKVRYCSTNKQGITRTSLPANTSETNQSECNARTTISTTFVRRVVSMIDLPVVIQIVIVSLAFVADQSVPSCSVIVDDPRTFDTGKSQAARPVIEIYVFTGRQFRLHFCWLSLVLFFWRFETRLQRRRMASPG